MKRRFYREIAAFRRKYAFNVHFFLFNIHFCTFNVHFFFIQKSAYVKISILEFVLLVQKQVSKKHLQIFCRFVNTFLQVRIVCTDKCISKIPRIFRKNIIGCSKAKCYLLTFLPAPLCLNHVILVYLTEFLHNLNLSN